MESGEWSDESVKSVKKKFLRFGGLGALHVQCVVLIQGKGNVLNGFLFFSN